MTITTAHQTKTELALNLLRAKLLSGELSPGDRLRVGTLTTEFQMSPTPIREALRVLQADGLVTYRPHHAIVVAQPPRIDDIGDVVRLRRLLEPFAVREAIPALTDAARDELENVHDAFVRAASLGRGTTVSELNAKWHWLLYEVSDNATLTDFIRQLWDHYPWRTMWTLPNRIADSVSEHGAVMQAIRVGEAGTAARAMYTHIGSGEASLHDTLPTTSVRTLLHASHR